MPNYVFLSFDVLEHFPDVEEHIIEVGTNFYVKGEKKWKK